MEQKSNVQYRAEKEYKNSREKFSFLLREILSNSLHAVLIRKNKEQDYIPQVSLKIQFSDNSCQIDLKDNGEGFTEDNVKYFDELDVRNQEKEQLNFHPLGQGRLAIVFFSDKAEYETVYKDRQGTYNKRIIPYPNTEQNLFSCSLFSEEKIAVEDSYTNLRIIINRQNSLSRAKTFFKKYPTCSDFRIWFVETFFPFIVNNDDLCIKIELNGDADSINKDALEKDIEHIPFDVLLHGDRTESFLLWIIKKEKELHGVIPIDCFARNLKADLVNGKLTYSIDNTDGASFYLTSDYFDEYVNTKGDKIEISEEDIEEINKKINKELDTKYKLIINRNQSETKRNINTFKRRYPSLEPFLKEDNINSGRNIMSEDDIVKKAVDEKGKIEKKFWSNIDTFTKDNENNTYDESEECRKLINSSLHIYVKHREVILKKLHDLLPLFKEGGEEKPELESTIHELFLKRGNTLKESSNINHLHNLWILDDKFTIFSNDFQAKSTRQGQSLSDIYIWSDNPEQTKQVLILELKSTTKAHNAGDKNESMVAQVRRYATKFYKEPTKVLNWDVDTNKLQYTGIILARKSDINKELTSNRVSGYNKIPFLENSYYCNDHFVKNTNDPMDRMDIRIEIYSFEDIYKLASSRNEVFFRLLQREFRIETREDENS